MTQKDDFGKHEVLHMTSFLMDAVERELLTHDQIKNNEEWEIIAKDISNNLYKLYNKIGEDHLG